VGELCAILHLDTGTVSPLVKRMEAAGLVERNRSPEDERSVNVRLSDAGRALERRAEGVPGAMAACLLADAEEYVTLKSTLSALVDRVESPSCGRN
jgi:DNA-binding MarR family transcriptional regulator